MTQTERSKWFAAIGFFIWLLVVLAGYYWVHKPFGSENLSAIGRCLLDLIGSGLLVAVSGGIGRKIIPVIKTSPSERIILQSALGVGVLAILVFAAGWLGWLVNWAAWCCLIVLILFLRKEVFSWLLEWKYLASIWKDTGKLERAIGVLSLALFLGWLVIALAPATKWDALVYHLDLPRRYIAAGHIHFISEQPFWGYPQIGEMLFTWAMLLTRTEGAAALGWWIALIAILGMAGFAKRQIDLLLPVKSLNVEKSSGVFWIAVASLVSGFTLRAMSAWAYVDYLVIIFSTCVLVALFQWREGHGIIWLYISAVFAGLAVSTKWTAGLAIIPIILGILFFEPGWYKKVFRFLQIGVIVILVHSPWLIKNFIANGNPFLPYFSEFFSTAPIRASFSHLGPGQTPWLEIIGIPVLTTWFGVEATGGYSADIGPFLLVFGLPGCWYLRKSEFTRLCMLTMLLGGLAMAVGSAYYFYLQQTRLYFPLLSCGVLLAAGGWKWVEGIRVHNVRVRVVTAGLILMSLGFSLFQDYQYQSASNPVQYLLGLKSSHEYLDTSLGWYSAAMRRLSDMEIRGKILMLWEPRGLYAPLNTLPDSWVDRWIFDVYQYQSTTEIINRWQLNGYTHVLINGTGLDFMRSESLPEQKFAWEQFDQLTQNLCFLSDLGGGYHFYKICQ